MKYYLFNNDTDCNDSHLLGVYKSYKDAVLGFLDYFSELIIDFMKEDDSNIDFDIDYFLDCYGCYIEEVKESKTKNEFDFNLISKIEKYFFYKNILICNLGHFELTKKQIKKFNTLIILK